MVADMSVQNGGFGAQYEDRTGAVIDIQSREGSSDRMHFRLSASVPDAGFLAEGPIGKRHKGSWMVSAHKSYLQYFLKDLSQDVGSLAFGFMDTQAQFNYQLNNNNAVSLKLIDGTSDLDRSSACSLLGLNAAELAHYHYTLTTFGWRFTPNHTFVLNTRAAFTRERYDNSNIFQQPLGNGYYGEWTAKSDATWSWSDNAPLQFGGESRPTHAAGSAYYYDSQTSVTPTNWYAGSAIQSGGYAQQSFTHLASRLSLSIGGRWDTLTSNGQRTLSPQASLAYTPWDRARLSLSWARYSQFPEISSLYVENGSARLLPAQAEHRSATFEQRLGEHTRFRAEAFQRIDRNLLFQPLLEARVSGDSSGGDSIVPDNYQAPILSSLKGVTKGAEFFLQRRTANGWTGWVSYTYSRSEMHDTFSGINFPSDQDQRHTINSYVSYRIRPSLNLSAKLAWGSGFPIPGFFTLRDGAYYLGTDRNLVRLPPYQRLDIRMNKSKSFEHFKMNLYVEVVNVLNHANYRFDSYNGYNGSTGAAYLSLSQMFPLLPSAGLTFEF